MALGLRSQREGICIVFWEQILMGTGWKSKGILEDSDRLGL